VVLRLKRFAVRLNITVSSRLLHYGVNEFLRAFVKHQIVSYVPNFVAKILLILTHDLDSTDQTMNDSTFYVMWVVGLEVQITSSTSRFPVRFRGQVWTPLHDEHLLSDHFRADLRAIYCTSHTF
jgi:hypothetical protein